MTASPAIEQLPIAAVAMTNEQTEAAVRALQDKVQELEKELAAHCAEVGEKWRAQESWTLRHDQEDRRSHDGFSDSLKSLLTRVTSLERKVFWFAGAAAMAGGGLGQAVQSLLS